MSVIPTLPPPLPARAAETVAPPVPQEAPAAPAVAAVDAALRARHDAGSSWFFWIAGLTVVNSIAAATGSEWGFALGLGITQVFDAIARAAGGGAATIVALGLDVTAAAAFVAFGVLARQRYAFGYIAGSVLYTLDTLISLVAQDWLGFGLHVLALVFIVPGMLACRRLNAARI